MLRERPVSVMQDHVEVAPASRLEGLVRSPGDKSISHRSLLLAALTNGTSTIRGLSHGEDVASTRAIVAALGAKVSDDEGILAITSDPDRLSASASPLECGNSGTTMRLTMGVVASISGEHRLVGDASLSTRPMDRVAEPLRLMGAVCQGTDAIEHAPITLRGSSLTGISYRTPMASAQVKSAILLAGLRAAGETSIIESVATRPHTEEMLARAGAAIEITHDHEVTTVCLRASSLRPQDWQVPADPSQAAFFVIAGALVGSGAIECVDLYPGATRTGFLDVLARMGGNLERTLDEAGHLRVVSRPAPLLGTQINSAEIPSLDEVPILAVAAAAASGLTVFHDVGELRYKESDRLQGTADLVRALGAVAHIEEDDLHIEGVGGADSFAHLELTVRGDHRMAMSAAIAGVVGNGASIDGFSTVASSYPLFLDDLQGLR